MVLSNESGLVLGAQQARLVHLAAQGLLHKPAAKPNRASVIAAVERMQLLQIDTIHVVARSPYLVLFSRLGIYPPCWLDEALESGDLFECWAHEACFVSSRDLALHRAHYALGGRSSHWAEKHAARSHANQREGMDKLLAHVRQHGPVKAADFERTQKAISGWWAWKDEKRWLEALFARGELMVMRRERFQRVYDLSERVIAGMRLCVDAISKPSDDIPRTLILRAVRALGIAQARWIADYYRTGRKHRDANLDGLVASGALLRIEVRGWEAPGYMHRDDSALLRRAVEGKLRATHTTLLSPFDPVVWDRARASALFDFDYTIECYVPAPKRRYGYFVLPILHRGRLVGRLDAKAHRADGVFEIKHIHLEPGVAQDASLAEAIAQAIQSCANWHETPTVRIERSDPRSFAAQLRKALRAG